MQYQRLKEDHSNLQTVDPDVFPDDTNQARAIAHEYAKPYIENQRFENNPFCNYFHSIIQLRYFLMVQNSLTAKKTKDYVTEVQVNGQIVQENYKKICNYSGKYIREESMSIWSEHVELYFLGSGYPMYFDFVKSSIVILFLIFISSGAFNLFSNAFMGSDCKTIDEINQKQGDTENVCQLSWTTLLSLANKRSDASLMYLQDIMNFITVITIVFVLQNLRTKQRVLNEECDALFISPSDYTILVQGIPAYNSNVQIDKRIQEEFNQQVQSLYIDNDPNMKDVFKVVTVTVCYNLDKMNSLIERRNGIIDIIKQLKKKELGSIDGKSMEVLMTELEAVKRDIAIKKKEYYDGTNPDNNDDFTGHAFITLNTEQGKNILIEEQDDSFFQNCCKKTKTLKLNGETVNIMAAPEPTDVNWHNLHIKSRQQFMYNIVSDCASFLLLVVSFVIILILMRIQSSGNQKIEYVDEKGQKKVKLSEKVIVQTIALVISLAIPALNYGLQICLTRLAVFERHHRKTKEVASLGVKLAVAQFINTAVIAFIIKVMFVESYQEAEDNIYTHGGLIFNQQYVFITNSIITGASLIVDGGRLYKVFQKKFSKIDNMTQRQINTLYEEPEHNLALEYSGLLKTMLFTAFYAPLIPIGIILSIFGVILLYYVQKYKILNHRTIRYSMSNQLSLEMIELMEYVLPVYCLANITYEYILIEGSHVSIFSILAIGIGIFNIFLPMGAINEVIFRVRPCPPLKETYEENLNNFLFDYDRANPATDDYARKIQIDKEVGFQKAKI